MREMKFDAIYKPTGEHFTPHNIHFENRIIRGDFDGEINGWCHFSLDGSYGDAILRQYTGLKDKNGKMIFEGDILDLSSDEESVLRCEVVYEAPSFCRKWHKKHTIHLRHREVEPMAWNTHIIYEVIGNIYENAELVKK